MVAEGARERAAGERQPGTGGGDGNDEAVADLRVLDLLVGARARREGVLE